MKLIRLESGSTEAGHASLPVYSYCTGAVGYWTDLLTRLGLQHLGDGTVVVVEDLVLHSEHGLLCSCPVRGKLHPVGSWDVCLSTVARLPTVCNQPIHTTSYFPV